MYLRHLGHGQAAAKLQQYWLRDPQDLPFAPKIERKALISLVQKGLKYNQIEHSKVRISVTPGEVSIDTMKSAAKSDTSPAAFYFGPQTSRARASASSDDVFSNSGLAPAASINGFNKTKSELTQDGPRAIAQSTSKHISSNHTNGPNGVSDAQPLAQQRAIESHEQPHQPTYSTEYGQTLNGMDIDEGSPQPLEPQLVSTLIEGFSKAIQSESVKDLGPISSPLTFADRQSVLHAVWNPDPQRSILALGGVGLCQLLHFTDRANTKEPNKVEIFQSQEISMVTSMAWSPDGAVLAIAARIGSTDAVGNVSTWTADGKALDELSAAQDLVLKLRWNTQGGMLLGITATGDSSSSLIAWDMHTTQAFPIQCGNVITDAIWTGENAVTLCGAGALGRWDVWSSQGISWAQKANPEIAEQDWTHIFYEPSLEACHVFAEESAHIASINSLGVVNNLRQIHSDSITQISGGHPRPVFVTSSLDGSVKVWEHALRPVSTLQFGQDSPPLTAALNGQSSLLAAANQNKVLVWDSSGRQVPIASLKVDLGKGLKLSLPNGNNADRDSGIGDDGTEDGLSEPSVSLDWDSSGKRLALGIGNQVCIRRCLECETC